jgi:hypothetical protein
MRTAVHASTLSGAKTGLDNVENLLADDSIAVEDVVFVANGDGVVALFPDGVADKVRALQDEDVRFRACSNSIRDSAFEEPGLLDGVAVVTSGIGELTRLQADGYAYVKP